MTVATTGNVDLAASESRPAGPERNLKPWAIGAALVVIAGFVAALVTGGGGGSTGTTATGLPAGGQSTTVSNAPPPKKGDKVVAAAQTHVHDIAYRIVVTIPDTNGPAGGQIPVYFNEYTNGKVLQRFLVPNAKFFRDSVVADFKVEANPDPNPDKTAGIAFSWFHHVGDQTAETKYYGVTQHGIQLY